jgi:hypothetical protein
MENSAAPGKKSVPPAGCKGSALKKAPDSGQALGHRPALLLPVSLKPATLPFEEYPSPGWNSREVLTRRRGHEFLLEDNGKSVSALVVHILIGNHGQVQIAAKIDQVLRNPHRTVFVVLVGIIFRSDDFSLMPGDKFCEGRPGAIPVKRSLLVRGDDKDVSPGLYDPEPFLDGLDRIKKMFDDVC